ncbi:hypothetical protein niasHT_001898 [Heterodera trifolii]|uniref:Uncharacterized protein n=1 Tax=Heterodera trifolii TaxID=157864 RepID=A0ABD2LSG7_9BILA
MPRRADVLWDSEIVDLRSAFAAVQIFAECALLMQDDLRANHVVELEVQEGEFDVSLAARGFRNFFCLPLYESLQTILSVLDSFKHRVLYDNRKFNETEHLLAWVRQIVEQNNEILRVTREHLTAAAVTSVQSRVVVVQNISSCLLVIGLRGNNFNERFRNFLAFMSSPTHLVHF